MLEMISILANRKQIDINVETELENWVDKHFSPMPAFKILHEDSGFDYITSMSAGITLEQAKAYFRPGQHYTIHENFETGKETKSKIVDVVEI